VNNAGIVRDRTIWNMSGERGDHGPHLTTSLKSASIGVTVNAN
jgi:hypothetical protein